MMARMALPFGAGGRRLPALFVINISEHIVYA